MPYIISFTPNVWEHVRVDALASNTTSMGFVNDSIDICINIVSFSWAPCHGSDYELGTFCDVVEQDVIFGRLQPNVSHLLLHMESKPRWNFTLELYTRRKIQKRRVQRKNSKLHMNICKSIIACTFCFNHHKLHCYFALVINILPFLLDWMDMPSKAHSHPTIPWVSWIHNLQHKSTCHFLFQWCHDQISKH